MSRVITIDGPASSGKTTLARLLAKALGWSLLESGKFYRFVTYTLLEEKQIEKFLNNELDIKEWLCKVFNNTQVKLNVNETEIFYKNKKLEEELRRKEVEDFVSKVSAVKEVREFLTNYMRELVKGSDVIAEGRDMGSVVFPFAEFKFFLTADPEVRAKRRLRDVKEVLKEDRGEEEVKRNILERDKLDSSRKVAPLKVPEGAIVIDTTNLTPEDVLKEVLSFVKKG